MKRSSQAERKRINAKSALASADTAGEVIALLDVDEPVTPPMLREIAALPQVLQAKALRF